jgi:glycosyltransferase involved in cell wall biosynthesis
MTKPAITVLMPVYNGENYLREAMESILAQTFPDFEFLIINDGSLDKSEEIILSYSDSRIRYVKNPVNLKLIATLNIGFNLAQGKYVARADADDINYLDRLREQYDFMEEHPEIGLSGTGIELFGENMPGKTVLYSADHNTIRLKHLYQIHLSHGTAIFRMDVIRSHNLFFDASYSHAEDYELWTRFSRVSKLANIEKPLYKVRHHEDEVSKLYASAQQQNSLRVKQREFMEMGLELSEKEIELFTMVSQHEYKQDTLFVKAVKNLLQRMVEANDRTGFIEVEFFKKSMGQFWLNTVYNCTSLGLFSFRQFYLSGLSTYRSLTISERSKFFLRAFLRI